MAKLFLFVALTIALTCVFVSPTYGSCLEKVKESKSGLLGGWQEVDLGDEGARQEIHALSPQLEQSLEGHEGKLKLLYEAESHAPKVLDAYKQTVAGTNYCIVFEVEAPKCSINDVQQKKCQKTHMCAAEIQQGLVLILGAPSTVVRDAECN